MLDVNKCAEILEVHRNTVIYYLQNKYLKGLLVEGKYKIASKDLETFEDEYTQSKTKNLRASKNFTHEDYSSLSEFVKSVKDGMNIDELVKHYSQVEIKIPSQIIFSRFKRNNDIKKLRKDGYTVPFLAGKFNLSIKTIEKIVYKKETL